MKKNENKKKVHETYFEDIEQSIKNMSEDEMLNNLLELEQTIYWVAILKYLRSRSSLFQSAVLSGDPFKDPTNVARNQGVLIGLSDIQNMVILIKRDSSEKKQMEEDN